MFRELKFESDADVGQTETFCKGLRELPKNNPLFALLPIFYVVITGI